ncbi:hypothetical protein [Marinobacter nauticus]|uniref:hypothetical protein n=1 Tax=Marinobacter nauticus TaxID=2743 RepID=UPI000F2ABBE7|nr:hypothetical protein [Marinobacter nauticus]RKR79205.1 hypothetical protein C7436_0643 [Marinobacter nauticus]
MARRRIALLLSASAVFALCSLASAPAAAEVSEEHVLQLVPAEQSAATTPVCGLGEVTENLIQPERLPGSPGGVHVIGGGSSNSKLTVAAKETLPGGAAGVAATGIRGPDTA